MMGDALLHLAEFILHIPYLIGTVAHLHRLIHLAIRHTLGSVHQMLQRPQLVMTDEEAEQREQQQTDKTDNEGQSL